MANLFSSDNYPETEPAVLYVGNRWTWKRSDLNSDYANDTYTLSYELLLKASTSANITLTASASGTDYVIEIASATTAAYTLGEYCWIAYITRDSDSERITIDSGNFTLKQDKAVSTADPRSHAQIALDAIESVLESRASQDQMSYSIAGRSLSRMSPDELFTFRDQYRSEVVKEKRIERRNNGTGTGALVKVRF